jgi:serine O-acetyltransferase
MSKIKQLISDIISDFPEVKPGTFRFLYFLLLNAPFRLALNYRIGHFLVKTDRRICLLISEYLKYKQITKRNCQISYNAKIGKHIFFPHPISIVIGEKVIIEDNVTIWQNVTLGSHGNRNKTMAYPIVKSRVRIFPGTVIIGGVVIGQGTTIGANSFVNKSIPPDCTAFGIPVKINFN